MSVNIGPQLTRQQKWQFFGLLVFSVIIVFFALKYVQYNITKPYGLPGVGNSNADNFNLAEQSTLSITQDTDSDGLTDYDENFTYYTSPYLADTDSDGISDKVEITSGTDPNCAKGASCEGSESTSAPTGTTDLANMTPDELRQLLISSGMDSDEVNALSDEDLMNLYLQASGQTPTQTPTGEPTTGGTTPTPDELRQSLIDSGVDPAVVNSASDEELLQAYEQMQQQ